MKKLSLDLLSHTKKLLEEYKPLPVGPLLCPPNVPSEFKCKVEEYNKKIQDITEQLFMYGCVSYHIDGINLFVHSPKYIAIQPEVAL